ncbi:hypothetical protein HHI36_014466 [Cryptolaemus montrouzieri]|uniref:Uncharacterized protein n=1 Tax=Cryptolaemus montrouzieri TaxID=559131 RepID=A0ABD2N2W6_9CUCU
MSDDSYITNPRTTWSSKHYYEIGLIGFVLGVSNSLYLFNSIKSLGGTFSTPYLLFTLVLGIPLVILELSLSQYGQKDMIQIWELCPVFKGLGWDVCTNDWNTPYCFTLEANISRRLDCYDLYGKQKCDKALWETSHNQYWFLVVQKIDFGMFQWVNMFHCFGVTTIAFALTCKGIKIIEKMVFWFLIFAAIQFTLILYCSFIQHGSGYGLSYFFSWNLTQLNDKLPWAVGIKHVVVSTGIGTGGLRTLGSQNHFRGHSYMNGMMIILVDTSVTVLYMLLYLSLCGNLSYFSNQQIEDIFKDPEPEFWSKIPRMLHKLEGSSKFWQCTFYSQIFLVLLSKTLVLMFIVLKTIFNKFPRTENHFMATSLSLYFAVFLCCATMFSQFGTFIWKQLISLAIRGPMILLMNFLQITVILYIYGLPTVVDDLHFMLGFRLPFHWQVILFFSPIILGSLWILHLLYFYEHLGELDGITLTRKIILNIVAYSPIFTTAGYAIWFVRMLIWKCKRENVLRPSESWYLSDPILRKSRQMFSAMSMTKEYLYRQTKRQEKEQYDFDDDAYTELE